MMSNDILYIVIPAYNEDENICEVVEDWYPVVEMYGSSKSKLVIIDDGSMDATYQLLKNLEDTGNYPMLTCVQKENSGHGQLFYMDINMQLVMERIISFKQIQMDKPCLKNLMRFGKTG